MTTAISKSGIQSYFGGGVLPCYCLVVAAGIYNSFMDSTQEITCGAIAGCKCHFVPLYNTRIFLQKVITVFINRI